MAPIKTQSNSKRPAPILAGIAFMVVVLAAAWFWSRRAGSNHANEVTRTNGIKMISNRSAADGTLGTSTGRDPSQQVSSGHEDPRKPLPNPLRERMASLVRKVAEESDPGAREKLVQDVLKDFKSDDFAHALAALGDPQIGDSNHTLFGRVLEEWARGDAPSASAWVKVMSAGADKTAAASAVARAWASRQPDQAIGWARMLALGDERDSALMAASYEIARTDPRKALTLASEFLGAAGSEEFLSHAAARWGEKEPAAAVEWVRAIADQRLRDHVLAELIPVWAESDAPSAATAAIEGMNPGAKQNNAVISVIQRWSGTQPSVVAEWVSGFQEGELKLTAFQELARNWADANIEQTESWIRSLPQGVSRDHAAAALAEKLVTANPSAAADWAASIGPQAHRVQEINKVLSVWLKADEAAAKDWMGRNGLGVPPAPDAKP